MAITAADLAKYVGVKDDDSFVATCFAEATALVDNHIGAADVPADVKGRCYLEAGSELFHRRQAPNGIAQFATPDGGGAVRVARDPLVGVYPLTAGYLLGGFA